MKADKEKETAIEVARITAGANKEATIEVGKMKASRRQGGEGCGRQDHRRIPNRRGKTVSELPRYKSHKIVERGSREWRLSRLNTGLR